MMKGRGEGGGREIRQTDEREIQIEKGRKEERKKRRE